MHQVNKRPGLNIGHTYVLIFGATLGPQGRVCLHRRKGGAVSLLHQWPVAPQIFNKTQFGSTHRHTQNSLHINQYLDSIKAISFLPGLARPGCCSVHSSLLSISLHRGLRAGGQSEHHRDSELKQSRRAVQTAVQLLMS